MKGGVTLYDFCTDGDCETCDLVPTEDGGWVDADDYALLSDAYAMLENESVGLRVAATTARADALREVREKVAELYPHLDYLDRDDVLAILGGEG